MNTTPFQSQNITTTSSNQTSVNSSGKGNHCLINLFLKHIRMSCNISKRIETDILTKHAYDVSTEHIHLADSEPCIAH